MVPDWALLTARLRLDWPGALIKNRPVTKTAPRAGGWHRRRISWIMAGFGLQ